MIFLKHTFIQYITATIKYHVLAGIVCLSVGIISCNPRRERKKMHSVERLPLPSGFISASQVYTVKNQRVENELNPTGQVSFDEENIVKITSPINGLVEQVKVEAGNYVKKGQVLAIVRLKETATSNPQIIHHKNGQASQNNTINAEDKYHPGEPDVKKTDGASQANATAYALKFTIKSPIDGFLVEKNISAGMHLYEANATDLFTISNLNKVWVIANVYQTDLDKILPGYEAVVTTLSYPNHPFTGKIDKIFNTPDQQSNVSKIRLTVDNREYLLKPDMFASVTINFEGNEQKPAIPAQAIVFDKNKNFVIIFKDKHHLSVREVNIYKTLNGVTYLSSGVKPGETIIFTNQIPIYQVLNK